MRLLILAGLLLPCLCSCQSVKNVTNIYVQDHSSATITSDGGSNAKPIDVARGLSAEIPASAITGGL
jgi:hypothetical protein